MAYRQLFCVACVTLGLGLIGCGGNSAASAVDPATNDSAPGNPDSPPSSADGAPPNADDNPPGSADTPPGSADNPGGGGRIQQLCEDACEVLEALGECNGDGLDPMAGEVCANNGCAAAIDPAEPIPCLDQIEALFRCIANLSDVCMPSEQQAAECRDDVEAFGECADDQEPIDEPDPVAMCTPGGGCDCPTECAGCLCENPGAAGAQECLDICSDENM